MSGKQNKTAKHIFNLGLAVIILGIIGSFVCGKVFEIETVHGYYYTYTSTDYNWIVAICGSVGSVLTGCIYIALSEIIELLSIKHTNLYTQELIEIRKAIDNEKVEIKNIEKEVKQISNCLIKNEDSEAKELDHEDSESDESDPTEQ